MASIFLRFFGINMGYFFGRICDPVFDFFFAIKTIHYIALIITPIFKRLKRKLFGAYPSLFMGHISVRLKVFRQYFSREFCRRWGAGSPSPSGVAHQAV
jgi:hypothetical protein